MIRFQPVCRRLAAGLIAPAALFLSGCATSSVWTPYPAQTAPLIREVEHGREVDAGRAFGRRAEGRDRVLYLMEQGRLAQVQRDWPVSRAAYAKAIAAIREADDRAVISAGRSAAQASSVILNDNAIPYVADGYERVMLHHEQALNYLFARDLEGAGVEVRIAAAEQAEALKRRAKELEDSRRQAGGRGVPAGDLATVNARLDRIAGRVKNSFQNAYTFYMSAVVREMLDDPNGAYIDYKKAAEIMPDNPFVRADVLRLAEDLAMDDAADFRARWPNDRPNRVPEGMGELVVLFEDGFLPPREEFSLPIPLFSGGFTMVALPLAGRPREPVHPVTVRPSQGPAGETAVICNLNALAARALQERMPAIFLRQALRATAKAMTPQLAHHGQERDILVVLMSMYSLVSERADLRSWNTLPQAAQVYRVPCLPGRQVLTLTHRGTGAQAVCEADVRPGGRTIVLATRTGGRLRATAVTF